MKLESYVGGKWLVGNGHGRPFHNPVTGEVLGYVDASGIDISAALDHTRSVGLRALGELSFVERGAILNAISDILTANREKYGEIARLNSGNTAFDAAIDIDGGIGVLKVYARLGQNLGAAKRIAELGRDQLARDPVFFSRHFWSTRPGVAVQVNAFNFPSWGMWEKIAVALLAGVPSVTKPASATAWLSAEMMRDVVAASVVPDGVLSLICGQGEGLISAVTPMDSLAFTGSANTAQSLRANESVLRNGPRVTIEADSVNATVVGPDAREGTVIFDLAVREVVKALTVKAGQLCTNIRRVLVQEAILPALETAVAARLNEISIGDPVDKAVRMGPLINCTQRDAALAGITALSAEAKLIAGGAKPHGFSNADWSRGAFVAPTLLRCADPSGSSAVHEIEVFGPCVTLMPYRSIPEAVMLAARAGGSLTASLFTNDIAVAVDVATGLAPWHGRVLVVDETVGKNHTGHAIVMPQCVHGGPGRAGGGEELGGLRGLRLHMQRSAVQGSPELLSALAREAAEAAL